MTTSDASRALEAFGTIKVKECTATVLLAAIEDDNGPPSYRRIGLQKKVGDDFKEIVTGTMSKYAEDIANGDAVFQKYADLSKLDAHEIEWLEIAKAESISEQLPNFKKILEVPLLGDDEKSFLDKLRFYVLVLHLPSGKDVAFFRVLSPQRELGRSAKYAFMLKKGHFDKFEQKVFLFDSKLDCALVGGYMLIFQKSNFQKIFRYFELLEKVAESTLEKIEGNVPIENFPEFADACRRHQYMMAKLKNISETLDFKKASIENIKKVIKAFNLKVAVVKSGGKELLHFDPKDKWAILKLLDDDYLNSELTGAQYEVNSKREMAK